MRGGLLSLGLVMVMSSLAAAQMPASPGPAGAPAPPDTALARLGWSGAGELAPAVSVWPDTVLFGDEITVILDLPDGTALLPADSLRVDVPWLEPVAAGAPPSGLSLPPPEGPRQLLRYRVYREGPWRLAWERGPIGPVLQVRGRVDDASSVHPVRDPRALGGLPFWLVALLAVALVISLVVLAWWRWRRRGQAELAPACPGLDPPAWLDAAIALRGLDQQSLLGRDYLDRLAVILRQYLEARYVMPATEMTGPEIAAASRRAGWHADTLQSFGELIEACDDARYRPEHVGSAQVDGATRQALRLMAAVRVQPEWTPVPVARMAEARAAWDQLCQRYPAEQVEPGRQAC